MSKKVKVFATPSCPWCTKVKLYLKDNEVKFKEIDVSKDMKEAMKMVKKSGKQGVPQLWIGSRVVVGFDKQKIDNLLNLS